MVDRRFLLQCLAAIVIVGGVMGLLFVRDAPVEVLVGSVAGLVMSTLNAVAGSLCIGYAFDKSQNVFLKVVYGGMVLRMGSLLLVFFVLITVFQIHKVALTVSLLGFYLIFLVMEIFSILRRVEARERAAG